MQKIISVKTQEDEQLLKEYLSKGWKVKFKSKRKKFWADDIDSGEEEWNEYIIQEPKVKLSIPG